ncbi:MAG: hypothetical protein ACREOQ_07415 [Gemmatimonadales bacterium]
MLRFDLLAPSGVDLQPVHRGGAVGSGLDLPEQALPADSLHLSREEKRALVAFLGALTDTAPVP